MPAWRSVKKTRHRGTRSLHVGLDMLSFVDTRILLLLAVTSYLASCQCKFQMCFFCFFFSFFVSFSAVSTQGPLSLIYSFDDWGFVGLPVATVLGVDLKDSYPHWLSKKREKEIKKIKDSRAFKGCFVILPWIFSSFEFANEEKSLHCNT